MRMFFMEVSPFQVPVNPADSWHFAPRSTRRAMFRLWLASVFPLFR
jgi:hypothetical protein